MAWIQIIQEDEATGYLQELCGKYVEGYYAYVNRLVSGLGVEIENIHVDEQAVVVTDDMNDGE